MSRKPHVLPGHVRILLDITRQSAAEGTPYHQLIPYETDDVSESVASALTTINATEGYQDVDGRPVGTIAWENSCLQKKCGACAMVIDGRPALACGTLLRDHRGRGPLTLEPLSKFPVIADLQVDRSIMLENLRTFGMWEDGPAKLEERRFHTAYEASRCLQCGCCLEVCPNFAPDGEFFGAAGFVPASRLLSTLPREDRARVRKAYLEHEYEGCGKSLACQDVCPADIDIEHLLVRSSAATLFNR